MRPLTKLDLIAFFSMVFGMFMAILDIQIVASSLSEIQAGLSASPEEIAWVQTSYLIAEVIMIPLSGWLSRVLSTRVLFTISSAGFTLSSALCAFAWNIESMTVFRALQGFLGGAMIPTAFATSFLIFPPQMRPRVGVVMGLVATMAPTLGPTIGGWISDFVSWHWLFLVNIVPGIIVTMTVATLARFDHGDPALLKGFDVPGIVFVALFLGCLEYFLEEGPTKDWFSDPAIQLSFTVMVVSGVLFFWRELTYHNPVIDLRAFRNRNFALGCLFSFTLGIGLYGGTYITPLFLGRIGHFTALQIGQTMMVVGIAQLFSGPIAGILSRRMDPRLQIGIGMAMFGSAMYLMTDLTHDSGYWEFFWPQVLRGLSLMMCFVPINQITLGLLPPSEVKNASGLYNLTRNLGGAIGLAGLNTLLIQRQALHDSRIAETLNTTRPAVQPLLDALQSRVEDIMPGTDGAVAALRILQQLALREAMTITFIDGFLAIAACFATAIFFLPLLSKVRAPTGGGGGGH